MVQAPKDHSAETSFDGVVVERDPERGGSLAALLEILGHSTIVTTQRYAGLAEHAVREEA